MAISKTQNERPAIIELIDVANETSITLEDLQEQIGQVADDLAAETEAREGAVNSLTLSLGAEVEARENAVNGLTLSLGAEVEARENAVDGLTQSLGVTNQQVLLLAQGIGALDRDMARIKIGETETVTVPANDSYSGSYVFAVPFAEGSSCIVILQAIADELLTLLDVTLTGCTYDGFSYQITNSDADAHDVKLGFVALRTNSD